jgi:hypothetical protein
MSWRRRVKATARIFLSIGNVCGLSSWEKAYLEISVMSTEISRNRINQAQSSGCLATVILTGRHLEPITRKYNANWLAKLFLVSSEVIERCMQRDKL